MKLHDRVHLVNPDSQHFGRIVGLATEIERHNLWLVSLDQGFWSEDKQIFVRVLPVHEDNLELVAAGRTSLRVSEGTKPSLQSLAKNVLSFAKDMSEATVPNIARELVAASEAKKALGHMAGTGAIMDLWNLILQYVLDESQVQLPARFQKARLAVEALLPKE